MAIKIKKSSKNNKNWLNKNIYVRIKTRNMSHTLTKFLKLGCSQKGDF